MLSAKEKRAMGLEPTTFGLGILLSACNPLFLKQLQHILWVKMRVTSEYQVTDKLLTGCHYVATDPVCDLLLSSIITTNASENELQSYNSNTDFSKLL